MCTTMLLDTGFQVTMIQGYPTNLENFKLPVPFKITSILSNTILRKDVLKLRKKFQELLLFYHMISQSGLLKNQMDNRFTVDYRNLNTLPKLKSYSQLQALT